MQATLHYPNLTKLREQAGLGVREFARQLSVHHTTILQWERAGRIAKADYIPLAANILGVTVEELLGLPKSRNSAAPGGKLGQAFRKVSELPRRQQQKIIEMAEGFIALHENAKSS